MNLQQAIELFLDRYDVETTRRTYAKALRVLNEIIGPARQLEEVGIADIVRVHNHLRKQPWSAATLQQRVKAVKTLFKWLHDMSLIESNPARVIKSHRPRRPQTDEKAMTDDELDLLLRYVRFRNRRDLALFMFLADTGCRVGGAAGLTVDDIDWPRREATVTEKGNVTRRVRFGPDCAVVLSRYLTWRGDAGPYVFSVDGLAISGEVLSQRVRRACYGLRKLGYKIRILSAHSMRHRKGHQMARARVAPSIAATALGHESTQTTIDYYYPSDWESAAEELDNLALEMPSLTKLTLNPNRTENINDD